MDHSDGKYIYTENTTKDGQPFMPVPDDPPERELYEDSATRNPIDYLRQQVQQLTVRVWELTEQRDALIADGQEMLREIERLERSDAFSDGHGKYSIRARLAADRAEGDSP